MSLFPRNAVPVYFSPRFFAYTAYYTFLYRFDF